MSNYFSDVNEKHKHNRDESGHIKSYLYLDDEEDLAKQDACPDDN